jgi:hypothetical protein
MTENTPNTDTTQPADVTKTDAPTNLPKEIGGSKKPEPTRYGDWEVGGICSDF